MSDNEMSELEVKDAVRERDGYRCRDHESESIFKSFRFLEVACPAKRNAMIHDVTRPREQPMNVQGSSRFYYAGDDAGLMVFWFNLYKSEDRRFVGLLQDIAKLRGITVNEALDRVIVEGMKAIEFDYYCI